MRALIAFLVGLLIVPALGFLYFRLGYAPVATSAQPIPFENYLANGALHARIDRETPKANGLPQPSEANYLEAAKIYRDDCAICHGLPGREQTHIAKGMFPKPPELFQGKGVTDDSAGETYWKIKNGIRLTGMPSFEKTLSDRQMWEVSNLLANADKLPGSAQSELKR